MTAKQKIGLETALIDASEWQHANPNDPDELNRCINTLINAINGALEEKIPYPFPWFCLGCRKKFAPGQIVHESQLCKDCREKE